MTDERTDEPSHLGLTRRSAGRIMVVIAYVGVVSALVGAVVGWQFLGELSNANKQGLVLAEETLSAVDTSLDVANDVVDAVDDALAALSSTILAVGDGIDATTAVAGSTAQLAATLPDTIDPSGCATVKVRPLTSVIRSRSETTSAMSASNGSAELTTGHSSSGGRSTSDVDVST